MNNKLRIPALLLIVVLLAIGSGFLGFKPGAFNFSPQKIASEFRIAGPSTGPSVPSGNVQVVTEESVTIDVVKKVTPSVVTIGITQNQPVLSPGGDFGPFGGFFGMPIPQAPQQGTQQVKQDIGSGFIVQSDGLILTNKHVVSDTTAKYRVITADNQTYNVSKIYRDPNNDLAILKIDANNLPTVTLGDSSKLQVGQFAIAIGTALGEFRSTVTTGVVSGIGRNITAGSPYEGSEQLSNILQTSAAINPGNSGGPLLNSAGQVIGVNVAVASNAQNIGFALPINLVKQSLSTFQANGKFPSKAYLGVQYAMVTRELSILNEIPEGAYIQNVVSGSPADKAGLEQGDIITKVNGNAVRDSQGGLAKIIDSLKPGDSISLEVFRGDNQTVTLKTTLIEASQ